jgi:hypothetical protein
MPTVTHHTPSVHFVRDVGYRQRTSQKSPIIPVSLKGNIALDKKIFNDINHILLDIEIIR